MLIDVVPFLVLVHLCLLGSFDSFWRQSSQVYVFSLTASVSQGALYLVSRFCWNTLCCRLKVCFYKIFIFVIWGYLFLPSLVVLRICFLIPMHIYL